MEHNGDKFILITSAFDFDKLEWQMHEQMKTFLVAFDATAENGVSIRLAMFVAGRESADAIEQVGIVLGRAAISAVLVSGPAAFIHFANVKCVEVPHDDVKRFKQTTRLADGPR